MENEPGIFISYRHGDGSRFAMQLYEDLAITLGRSMFSETFAASDPVKIL